MKGDSFSEVGYYLFSIRAIKDFSCFLFVNVFWFPVCRAAGGRWTLEETTPQPGGASLQQSRVFVPQPQRGSLWAAPHFTGESGFCWVYHGGWASHDKRAIMMWRLFFLSLRELSAIMLFPKGQSSSMTKLKSLTGAMEIMTEAHHAFRLIQKELLEKEEEVGF